MKKKLALICLLIIGILYNLGIHPELSLTINGEIIEGPLKAILGLIINVLVFGGVAILLVSIFAGTGIILIGVFAFVGLLLLAIAFPFLLPLIIPLVIIWAICKISRRNKKEYYYYQ